MRMDSGPKPMHKGPSNDIAWSVLFLLASITMTVQERVCRRAPGGAARLCKQWHCCTGVMREQAPPRPLKETQSDVNDLIDFIH